MAWIASVAGALMSMDSANSASDKQQEIQDRQLKIQEDNLAMAHERYDRYKKLYQPLEERYVNEAWNSAPTADYGREKAAFEGGLNRVRDGIVGDASLSSGQGAGLMAGLGIEGAKGLAGIGLADDARKDEMKKGVFAVGQGQAGAAAQGLNQATGLAGNYFSQLSTEYGNQAAAASAAFNSNMSNLGKDLGSWLQSSNSGSGRGSEMGGSGTGATSDLGKSSYN